jgi:hypothetical protein
MSDPLRKKMIAHLERKSVKCVFLNATKPISPAEFSAIVRNAGGYVPAPYGLQVDMNGRFVSLHALRSGKYEFRLPRRCLARNLKTGMIEAVGERLHLNMTAGESRWYELSD